MLSLVKVTLMTARIPCRILVNCKGMLFRSGALADGPVAVTQSVFSYRGRWSHWLCRLGR